MSITMAALVEDLKALRTGLGVEDPNLVARACATVRHVSGVGPHDSPGIVREKIKSWLDRMISRLPEATARIGRATFGFEGPGDRPYLARLENLGRSVDREVRTMQRRADQVVSRIAELALVEQESPVQQARTVDIAEPPARQPWHTTLVRVDLILDQPGIEVFENRRVISHVDHLAEIKHWISVPPVDPCGRLDLAGLGIRLLGGGEMRTPPRAVSSSRVEIAVHPPTPLNTGDEHDFFFRVQIPSLQPFYACTPRFACDEFQLRVRFGRERIPERIWLIDGELPMEAGDPVPDRPALAVDNAGEVQVTFVDLVPATSYGIGWQPR
ncbi:hypothetical protein [Actinocrispum wychmicini]|uniref:Uncharacterized protein n=1 Tax=Actinocrispum wychmicini TaxID=1213861 RepID=A0A4V6NNU3_9PSEU|nr:hypothetical protein [Actinocrispum wychmicini]TCO55820.1 hypothetical protein EV192_107243 [Actinocrispum wychmicini]